MAKIRLCPKCKKPTLRPALNVSGWLAPDMFECKECDYVGRFHIIVDSKDYKLDDDDSLDKIEKE